MKTFIALCICVALATAQDDLELRKKYPEMYSGYFEGDMRINANDVRNGLIDETKRWPNGNVAVDVSTDFTDDEREIIFDALREIQTNTCIRFGIKTDEWKEYVNITKQYNGCFSDVGYQGRAQILNLGDGCLNVGVVIHEMMHSLGFYHEQSRTDRDEYVTIMWENIVKQFEHNFDKYDEKKVTDFEIPYDYGSLLHYPAYGFSKNGEPTIVPKDPEAVIGQREKMSDRDILKINKMYNCP